MDRYRQDLEQSRKETFEVETNLRRESEVSVKAMKTQCKEKYKKQIENLEAINTESLQVRIQEVERNVRELCRKDLEVQSEKFELRLKSGYIEITEHEGIVRQI